jgi:membrane protein
LMGRASADLVQTALQSASGKSSGILASVVGATTLLITASGVFGEMQSALNAIWKAQPQGTTVSRLVRARAASLGLVAALGFLLLVSLVISAILSGLSSYISAVLPFGVLILQILNLHVLDGEFRLKPISKPRGWPDVITVFLRSLTQH